MAQMRYREALNGALREELARDERVVLMGEDIGVFGGAFKVTDGLLEEFGERRVRDTPISENTIVGVGVGAAMTGLRPVVELMTINFALLAFDQIVNHAAHIHYMFGGQVKVPLVVRMPQGAGDPTGPPPPPPPWGGAGGGCGGGGGCRGARVPGGPPPPRPAGGLCSCPSPACWCPAPC